MTDVLGAVAEATAGLPRLYPLGGVPKLPDYPYGVYSASLGRGDSYTLDSREGLRWGRVVVQTFGKTAASALSLSEDIRAALVGVRLDITGYETTPCRVELDPQMLRDPDDNVVIGVPATYTFTATPTDDEES